MKLHTWMNYVLIFSDCTLFISPYIKPKINDKSGENSSPPPPTPLVDEKIDLLVAPVVAP